MDIEDIRKILSVSINAPSGSNSQPWRFEIKDRRLSIIALPEKDHPILNYRNRGTWFAHGALIENIRVISASMGYKTEIAYFPAATDPNLVSVIEFESSVPDNGDLSSSIAERSTNRKPYKLTPLTQQQLAYLEQSVEEVGDKGIRVHFEREDNNIKVLAHAIAANEIVTLEDKGLHRLFFNEIVWSKKVENKRKTGLYLKTMELKPPQEIILQLLRHWPIMNTLRRIGFAKAIAKGNEKVYSATPVIGAIIMTDDDQNFVSAGRITERIWLKAIRIGYSLHLMTGTLFFAQGIMNNVYNFSGDHRKLIIKEYKNIRNIFSVSDGEVVAALFRVGDAPSPSALSSKLPPDINFLD